MPTVEHRNLTDPNLHEPKGIASANGGDVYVADGAGSGDWNGNYGYVAITLELIDISTASSSYAPCPIAGTVEKIYSSIHGAIATADSVLTASINTTAITGGTITVANAGSAAGDIDSCTPSANNVCSAGDYFKITTDGASTNTVRCTVVFLIKAA